MQTSGPLRNTGVLAFCVLCLSTSACGNGGSNGSENASRSKAAITEASLTSESGVSEKLAWPVACTIGETCMSPIGYPDIDGDWAAFDCGDPGYLGHIGTDISNLDATPGTDILAAADGQVVWVLDGRFDDCVLSISEHPDCAEPSLEPGPNVVSGYLNCTDSRPEFCEGSSGSESCYWCTYGGNQIAIRHYGTPGVFATTYDHLKLGSATVSPGDWVTKGQKIAEMGSAGRSTGAHLHFGVWGSGYGQLVDPWAGPCGPNTTETLWEPGIQEAATAPPPPDPWECNETVCTYTGDW